MKISFSIIICTVVLRSWKKAADKIIFYVFEMVCLSMLLAGGLLGFP